MGTFATLTTDEFHDRVKKAIGSRITSILRPVLPEMKKLQNRFVHLKYDEIEDWKQFEHPAIDVHDGQEWITIFVYDENGNAPNYGR